jgi:type IV pilus assembly protein PilY1
MKASTSLRRILAATFAAAAGIGALTGPATVTAEDVDIFTSAPSSSALPNVLIMLDNSSNWSATLGSNPCNTGNMAANTKFAAEICALTRVVDNLPNNKVRMGLMLFTDSGDNGAYVRFGMRNMDAVNRPAISNMLKGFIANGAGTDNSGSNQPYAKAMEEVFKYFGGYTCPAKASADPATDPNIEACGDMTKKNKTGFGPLAFAGGADNGALRRDYRNNNTPGNRAAAYYNADAFYALDSNAQNSYTNPITEDCSKNFVIVISNGNPGTGGDSSTNPARDTAVMANISAPMTAFPTAATEIHASKFDEMAYYLHQTDVSPRAGRQNVITYTVAVYLPSAITYAADGVTVTSETVANPDQPMVALMKSAATLGGGKYYAGRDADSIYRAILEIINEVQAVNSVFVSASLPVSVNNQGTFLNQVYMGMFRPDGSGNPRWLGNLKEYKFVLDATTGSISLGDAKTPSTEAVNPATGFLSPSAWSYWTRRGNNPAAAGWPNRDFWINNPAGTPPTGADALNTNQGDGEVVEKGGAGEMMRLDFATSQAARRVFTCLSGGCASGALPSSFDTTTITGAAYETAFGANTTELPLLVNWIRGSDNFNGTPCDVAAGSCSWFSSEFGPGWPATVRPSIHGDVLHSRPVVINYPGDIATDVKAGPWVFYGANDGMLHAVKGGQNNAIAARDGHESWAFLAPEFYSKMKRQRDASPELRTPSTDPALIPLTLPKDYFFDGPIGVWEDPASAARWIFVTARRGGRIVYAFDVTDPTAPKFMWKKTSTDIPQLGQTWSQPFAFKLLEADGTEQADPTLVFGAGYDVGEDLSPLVSNAPVGRGIIVLNARTGVVKNAGKVVQGFMQVAEQAATAISDPVPSDISFLVSNAGRVYRGYFGDTAGNMWRLDIPSADVGTWKLFKFAILGPNKKFFYAPDVVHAGGYDVVLAGTGDREKPLVRTSQDSFYAVNDADWDPAIVPATKTVVTVAQLTQLSSTTGFTSSTSGATCTGSGTSQVCVCKPPLCLGWYRNLAIGEKVVNSPLTVAGTTYFSTNKPVTATSVCVTNLGEARAYGFSFFGGTPSQTNPDGTMGQPLTGGGLPPSPVGGVVEIEPGKNVAFIIGAGNKGSSVEGGRITIPVSSTRRKVYWNSAVDK